MKVRVLYCPGGTGQGDIVCLSLMNIGDIQDDDESQKLVFKTKEGVRIAGIYHSELVDIRVWF